jgi:hypothetical protein
VAVSFFDQIVVRDSRRNLLLGPGPTGKYPDKGIANAPSGDRHTNESRKDTPDSAPMVRWHGQLVAENNDSL